MDMKKKMQTGIDDKDSIRREGKNTNKMSF